MKKCWIHVRVHSAHLLKEKGADDKRSEWDHGTLPS